MTDIGKLKALWIAVARANFNPGKRQSCHICGKYGYVAEAHHIVPLGTQFDCHTGFQQPDHTHVWLCPTHHAIVHSLINGNLPDEVRGRRAIPILDDLDDEQLPKLLAIIERSGGDVQ